MKLVFLTVELVFALVFSIASAIQLVSNNAIFFLELVVAIICLYCAFYDIRSLFYVESFYIEGDE